MPDAVPEANATRVDALNAHRFLLGRDPAGEAVIDATARLTRMALIGQLTGSTEFRDILLRLAEDRAPPHAALNPTQAREAIGWARAQGWPAPAEAPSGLALLLTMLLSAPPVAAAIAALPAEPAAALAALREGQGALARLLLPATPEDARAIALLLSGAAPPPAARAGTLLDLLRAALGSPRVPALLLEPVAEGRRLPAYELGAEAAREVCDWAVRRLGASPSGFVGAALRALLALPAAAEFLARHGPATDTLAAALPDLGSGAQLLRATRSSTEDVEHAYLAVLGRAVENPAARRVHEGAPLGAVLGILLGSDEFRTQVLNRLAGGGGLTHALLPHHQRRAVDTWLTRRLALPGEGAVRQPAALLGRLLDLPALSDDLRRRHGVLWADARAGLAVAAREGVATGAIDYVTGDWIVGWATDPAAPDVPLEVAIRAGDALIGLGRADRPRPDAAPSEAGARAGFRIPWRGRNRAPPAEGHRFRIHDARDGAPIGAEFRLDSVFVEPRSTVQLLAGELAETRRTLARIEAMLPQLESFSAWPPEQHAAFRRAHRLPPPPAGAWPPGVWPPVRVIVDTHGVGTAVLRRVLAALQAQGHGAWTAACLHDPGDADVRAMLAAAAAREPRVQPWPADDEAGAVATGDAELVLLLPPGMVPAEAALAWFAAVAARWPETVAAFADEDTLVEETRWRDRHEAPVFRAALDPFVLAVENPCGELVCARRSALLPALAAAAAAPDGAARRWVTWAALAAAGPVAHIPRLLASRFGPPAASVARPPAAQLRPWLAQSWLLPGAAPPATPPYRITAIMPTRNGGALLARAAAALRDRAADPARLRLLLVDNGSDDPETLAVLADEDALRIDEPFNWSRLNNLAAARVEGELLLFVNDDTRMLTDGWDDRLRRLLAVPQVGAVGARLVYEDLTLQHAGIVFGAEALAAHEGVGQALDAPGPQGRWQRLRCVGGVTGAFLAMRHDTFRHIGGFDEHALGVTFNDVDLCLRLRAAGLRILYDPETLLVHYESKSRGIDDQDAAKRERAEAEARALVDRWGDGVLIDPGYNPHWSRWNRPFAAIREPSPAEIEAHVAATAARDPWLPRR